MSMYERKPWIREAIAEALLTLLYEIGSVESAVLDFLSQLEHVVGRTAVDDMEASQIVILIGMQSYFAANEMGRTVFESSFPSKRFNSLKKLNSCTTALLAACSTFPRVTHNFLLSLVLSIDLFLTLISFVLSFFFSSSFHLF